MIGQFPYFAPDVPFLKPAQAATDADKMLLWMYTQNKANHKILRADSENLDKLNSNNILSNDYENNAKKAHELLTYGDKGRGESGDTVPRLADMNPRLRSER